MFTVLWTNLTINLSDRKLVATFCEAIFEQITLVNVFGTSYEYQSRAESWRDVQPKTQEQFARMIYKISIYIYIELGCIICSKTYQKYLRSCSIRYIPARNAWPLSTPSGSHTAVEKIAHHWQPHALRAKANHEWWQQSDVSNFSDLTRREGWRRATKKGKSEEKSRSDSLAKLCMTFSLAVAIPAKHLLGSWQCLLVVSIGPTPQVPWSLSDSFTKQL